MYRTKGKLLSVGIDGVMESGETRGITGDLETETTLVVIHSNMKVDWSSIKLGNNKYMWKHNNQFSLTFSFRFHRPLS